MAKKFIVAFYTLHQAADPETLKVIWSWLDRPLISPIRFGSVERAKTPFTMDAVEQAAELCADEGFLFVRGANDGFLANFSGLVKDFSIWTVWLNAGAMAGKRQVEWLGCFLDLCTRLPVLYGYGCAGQEHDAKHLHVRSLNNGGAATAKVGVAKRDFRQFLPGIYWLTLFGKELVQEFGEERLFGLPEVDVRSLLAGQIAVVLKSQPYAEDMEQRLQIEAELADRLGAEFFFDRTKLDRDHKQSTKLLAALDNV